MVSLTERDGAEGIKGYLRASQLVTAHGVLTRTMPEYVYGW